MPPPAERSPSAPSLQVSGRRLLSRLTSQFGHKNRNAHDFYITIDDPHKQYSPGDRVTGSVHLRLHKQVRITHLAVCLHGFVQVYKNPGVPPSDGYRTNNAHLGTGTGSKSGEYFGNGFASLFEDESILCGDGRLDARPYQFNFILEFPDWDLPSSISFERGTISYMVTATLTRNQTISPTSQCDHKVYLVERIDVAQLLPPKPRTITLEPLSRRSKAKTQARRLAENDRKSRKTGSTADQNSIVPRGSRASSFASLPTVGLDGVHSTAPSEVSIDSLTGSQERGSRQGSDAASPRPSDGAINGSRIPILTKPITAEVESLNGGCLRGDQVPVRVRIDHTKHVKSLHGVIITLYRQARVDMHPAIPLGPVERGKEAKYEDYYPKSMTGLGGLSLSGAGSSHTFRKDLSQTVLPLIIDPVTLLSEVTGRVRVPDDVFPTISTVPGAMISFRYYVEVVLDIQGKLSSHDRNMGNLGGFASTIHQGPVDSDRAAVHPFGSPVIDTAALRRDKGVVACTFEIVIGTKDSDRRKGKEKAEAEKIPTAPEQNQDQHEMRNNQSANSQRYGAVDGGPWYNTEPAYYDGQYYDEAVHGQHGYSTHIDYYDEHHPDYVPSHDTHNHLPTVQMPQVEDESDLPEKERMKRAEARLLPSQPPDVQDGAVDGAQIPTAPVLPGNQQNGYPIHPPASFRPPGVATSSVWNGSMTSNSASRVNGAPQSRAPGYGPQNGDLMANAAHDLHDAPIYAPRDASERPPQATPWPSADRAPTDDKRDLERQRSHMEDSAPPEEEARGSNWAAHAPAPSAPVLDDDDDASFAAGAHDSHADAFASAELPRYER